VREFVSLVNPARDIGPSSIHGLTAQDLLHAPKFGEIAGLLFEALQGTVGSRAIPLPGFQIGPCRDKSAR
jgi:DNA polymerase III epsilon subunit-like protein